MCDIRGVRNAKSRQFIFAQKYSLDFIQHRLYYMFISNILPGFVTMTKILTLISTDHSPVIFYLAKEQKKKVTSKVKEFGNLIAP